MKKTLPILSIFLLLLLFTTSQTQAQSKDYTGKVVSLNNVVIGQDGSLSKEQAQKLVERAQPLAFMVGTGKSAKLYIVFNADGTYSGKKLAEMADGELVITGKVKVQNGMNLLIADKISAK